MQFNTKVKDILPSLTLEQFEPLAIEICQYQAKMNPTYQAFVNYLKKDVDNIQKVEEIPFLPIEFFKNQQVLCQGVTPEVTFQSSGTTGTINSKHHVGDASFYKKMSTLTFESIYGNLSDFHILALLPNYLEKGDSSLVFMVDHFMKMGKEESGFYLYDFERLANKLRELTQSNEKVLLIGVTFALLDFAEQYQGIDLSEVIVMETGGMKGRRSEMLRSEVHQILKTAWNLEEVHSEYGMTELLSQAYSQGKEVFQTPPYMKILLREINDPFAISKKIKGGINVIDLANIDSCCFIETKDIGQLNEQYFQVLGRFDNSDIRGCNLMVQ